MLITKSGERIPQDVAQNLIANYKDKKEPLLREAMEGKPETTSVWFDYDFCIMLMQDMLRKEVNGLRIYFGAYDNSHPDPDNKDKMTVVLVTTTGSRDQDTGDDNITSTVEEQSLSSIYNDGRLCPPKCNPPLP